MASKFKITLEYDGTNLSGYQIQDDAPTVQEILEDALYKLTNEKPKTTVAGRTDAGVHAKGQVVDFTLKNDKWDEYQIREGLNFHSQGKPISILDAKIIDQSFSARFDAKQRTYEYHILNRPSRSVLLENRVWWVKNELDINKMHQAAKHLLGAHDFSAFRAAECQATRTERSIDEINITQNGNHIILEIKAQSFLHNMVRIITGTLVDIARGKLEPDYIKEIIESKDRTKAGITAPPHGLYFIKVDY